MALASLDVFEEEQTLGRLQRKIALMTKLLEELRTANPKVLAVRQCGFVAGIEVDGGGAQVCLAAREHAVVVVAGMMRRPSAGVTPNTSK